MPAPDLVRSVRLLFDLVSKIDAPDLHEHLRTGSRSRPSRVAARAALGLDGSSETAWKQGRNRALPYTQRLRDILRGEFHRMLSGSRPLAERIWQAFQPPTHFLEGLDRMLERHEAKLTDQDRRDSEELAMSLVASDLPKASSDSIWAEAGLAGTTPARAAAIPVATPPWSATWLARQTGGWADRLIAHDDRVVYVYGARKSGKSALIETLARRLSAQAQVPTILRLNIGSLLNNFANHRDEFMVKQAILNGLLQYLRPSALALDADANFDALMIKVLSYAPPGPIYLILSNSDICLRQSDPDLRAASVAATAPLFSFLRPVADENDDPVLSRISVVLEGSRPLKDLCVTYPASPLNVATIYLLPRMKPGECAEQARLAGVEGHHEALRAQTGGHRSLLWPILRAADGGPAIPPSLAALPGVRRVTADLLAELELQPNLEAALTEAREGAELDLDELTRLQHTMYLSLSNPPAIACPLLEAALDGTATPVEAET